MIAGGWQWLCVSVRYGESWSSNAAVQIRRAIMTPQKESIAVLEAGLWDSAEAA
jgi:hypothetical protein